MKISTLVPNTSSGFRVCSEGKGKVPVESGRNRAARGPWSVQGCAHVCSCGVTTLVNAPLKPGQIPLACQATLPADPESFDSRPSENAGF